MDITKLINQKYKEVLELRFEMNRYHRYTSKWLEIQGRYSKSFEELKALENKKLKGGVMKTQTSTKGSRKARANEVLKDASSGDLAKLAEVISSTVNQIAEAEIGKENGKTTSPKILKKKKPAKTAKQKKVAKKENGEARLEKRAEAIKLVAKEHGTEIKRIWKKDGKRQSVCKALEKHEIPESLSYQTMNYLGLFKSKGAQAKLKKMGLI